MGPHRRSRRPRRARVGAPQGAVRPARVPPPQQRPELAQRGVDEADPDAPKQPSAAAGPADGCSSEVPEGARVRQRHAGRGVSLPARIEITDSLLWLLGFGSPRARTTRRARTPSSRSRARSRSCAARQEIVERELGLHVVWAPASDARSASIYIHSKLLLRLMEYFGFGGNRKRIPGWILGLPLSRLKWFLEGYREGDGVHSGERLGGGHPPRVLDRQRRAEGRPRSSRSRASGSFHRSVST